MKRRAWIAVLTVAVVAGVAVILLATERLDRHYLIYKSILRAEMLASSCEGYRLTTGKYPATLADLLQPPFDHRPSLESPKDLRDFWGNPYQYALVENEEGGLEPFVWTERVVDGRTELYGARRRADGTIVRFGVP